MMKFLNNVKRRLIHYKKLIDKYACKQTVFIYQMGKVGSTSLENSIPNAVHIHAFYSKNHTCPVRLSGLAKFGWRYYLYRIEQEVLLFILRQTFKRRKQTKIITLVREPITRNVSMFFHDIDAYLFAAHTNCMNSRVKAIPTRNQTVSLLERVFIEEFDHSYPITWFDSEFKPMTGIDIYQIPFDKEKGFIEMSNAKVQVLCLTLYKLNINVEKISKFIGSEIDIDNKNTAEEKWYQEIYNDFNIRYQLPLNIEHSIKQSRFYQHFFNENTH